MAKRTKKQKLRSEADRLCYEICKLKEPLCEVCLENMKQAHHFYPKGLYGHLRYDYKDNLISLCNGCHFFHHHRSDPSIHNTIMHKRGKRWYNRLKKKAFTKPSMSYQTIFYYENIIKGLRRELNRLQKNGR